MLHRMVFVCVCVLNERKRKDFFLPRYLKIRNNGLVASRFCVPFRINENARGFFQHCYFCFARGL